VRPRPRQHPYARQLKQTGSRLSEMPFSGRS
jgi:hypothetical protein